MPKEWVVEDEVVRVFIKEGLINKGDKELIDQVRTSIRRRGDYWIRSKQKNLLNRFYPDGKLIRYYSPRGIDILRERIQNE